MCVSLHDIEKSTSLSRPSKNLFFPEFSETSIVKAGCLHRHMFFYNTVQANQHIQPTRGGAPQRSGAARMGDMVKRVRKYGYLTSIHPAPCNTQIHTKVVYYTHTISYHLQNHESVLVRCFSPTRSDAFTHSSLINYVLTRHFSTVFHIPPLIKFSVSAHTQSTHMRSFPTHRLQYEQCDLHIHNPTPQAKGSHTLHLHTTYTTTLNKRQ